MGQPVHKTMLGQTVSLPQSPEQARLDKVAFEGQGLVNPLVRLSCPEFTSLCPVTGQPDFAHIVIDYVPASYLLETKSLKLFLGSFRNHGAFHETCSMIIASRVMVAIDPHWIRVSAFWFPRGGIPIDIIWQSSAQPYYLYIPPIEIPVYRAR